MDKNAEKYYGISPYAYCGGDPVNFGDYDGENVYRIFAYIDKNGNQSVAITVEETEDNFDLVYANNTKDPLKLTDQSIMSEVHFEKWNQRTSLFYLTAGTDDESADQMQALFFYLRDNTSVEWAASKYADGSFALGAFNRNKISGELAGAAPPQFKSYQPIENEVANIHNHPSGSGPSEADRNKYRRNNKIINQSSNNMSYQGRLFVAPNNSNSIILHRPGEKDQTIQINKHLFRYFDRL